jgi:hypothetical protein
LQQTLLRDDAYLPWVKQEFSDLTMTARLETSRKDEQGGWVPEAVRDGINRPVGDDLHSWNSHPGDWIAYRFPSPARVETISLVLDSALDQNIALSYHQKDDQLTSPPERLPKAFRLEGLHNNEWAPLAYVANNYQRLTRFSAHRTLTGIRYVLDETWGADNSQLFAFYFD